MVRRSAFTRGTRSSSAYGQRCGRRSSAFHSGSPKPLLLQYPAAGALLPIRQILQPLLEQVGNLIQRAFVPTVLCLNFPLFLVFFHILQRIIYSYMRVVAAGEDANAERQQEGEEEAPPAWTRAELHVLRQNTNALKVICSQLVHTARLERRKARELQEKLASAETRLAK